MTADSIMAALIGAAVGMMVPGLMFAVWLGRINQQVHGLVDAAARLEQRLNNLYEQESQTGLKCSEMSVKVDELWRRATNPPNPAGGQPRG